MLESYSKGTAKESSDIDLYVSSSLTGLKFVGLIERLRQPEYLHPDEAGVLSTWVEYEYNRNSYPITVVEDGKYVLKYVAYETMYEIFEESFLKYFVTHIEISTF